MLLLQIISRVGPLQDATSPATVPQPCQGALLESSKSSSDQGAASSKWFPGPFPEGLAPSHTCKRARTALAKAQGLTKAHQRAGHNRPKNGGNRDARINTKAKPTKLVRP